MKFFVTEFFVKIGKNAVHCKFLRKVSYICSAMHFYWLIYDWKYDRAQGIHGSSGKMERQESDKGGYWHQAMRQMI